MRKHKRNVLYIYIYIFRVGTKESRVVTVVVRGSTDNYMDDIERAIDDGVNVFKGLCKVSWKYYFKQKGNFGNCFSPSRVFNMCTGIGYRNEARKVDTVRGRSVRVWRHWIKLLGENSHCVKEMPSTIMRILAYNRSYPKTVLGPSALASVPRTGLWRRQGTEARITIIVWLPYPIPVPMVSKTSFTYKTSREG